MWIFHGYILNTVIPTQQNMYLPSASCPCSLLIFGNGCRKKKRSSCFLFGGCKPGPFRKLDGQNRTRNTEFIRYRRITTWIHLDPFIHLDLVGHVFFQQHPTTLWKLGFFPAVRNSTKKSLVFLSANLGIQQIKLGDIAGTPLVADQCCNPVGKPKFRAQPFLNHGQVANANLWAKSWLAPSITRQNTNSPGTGGFQSIKSDAVELS